LHIKKVRKDQASVDFFDPNGTPVRRAYMNGAPSVQMGARYDDYNGIFAVELWEHGRGFILHLSHEYDYELDESPARALVPAISRYEQDSVFRSAIRVSWPAGITFVRNKKD